MTSAANDKVIASGVGAFVANNFWVGACAFAVMAWGWSQQQSGDTARLGREQAALAARMTAVEGRLDSVEAKKLCALRVIDRLADKQGVTMPCALEE